MTGEWLEAGMFTAVSYKIGRLAERFTALTTYIGLLSWNIGNVGTY